MTENVKNSYGPGGKNLFHGEPAGRDKDGTKAVEKSLLETAQPFHGNEGQNFIDCLLWYGRTEYAIIGVERER